jgi:hypothetical protein
MTQASEHLIELDYESSEFDNTRPIQALPSPPTF